MKVLQLDVRPASLLIPYKGDPEERAFEIVNKLDNLGIDARASWHVDGRRRILTNIFEEEETMDNYPDTTWAGDPRAPWNQPEPWAGRKCWECRFCCEFTPHSLCLCEAMTGGVAGVEAVDPGASACECFEVQA